jgi:hypothetical protein
MNGSCLSNVGARWMFKSRQLVDLSLAALALACLCSGVVAVLGPRAAATTVAIDDPELMLSDSGSEISIHDREADAGDGGTSETPDPVARDQAVAAGLDYDGATHGHVVTFDFDRDGDDDVILSKHGNKDWPIMRRNADTTFTQVYAGTLRDADDTDDDDKHGCIDGDFGKSTGDHLPDGLPDIYCVEGACLGLINSHKSGLPCDKGNELHLQLADGGFSADLAPAWNVEDPTGRGRAAVVLDYDKDGKPDIALANDLSVELPSKNGLFRNSGGGFIRQTNSVIETNGASKCLEKGDIDHDGWTDLIYCYGQDGDTVRTATYRNDHGTFVDVTESTGWKGIASVDVGMADLNNDGWDDLIITATDRLYVYIQSTAGMPLVPDYVRELKRGIDVATGDVNQDGYLDIYICEGLVKNPDGTLPPASAAQEPCPSRRSPTVPAKMWPRSGISMAALPSSSRTESRARGTDRTSSLYSMTNETCPDLMIYF